MTTEDETGLANIVIWQNVTERYRRAVIGSRLVVISGTTQREGAVVHLVAQHVDGCWVNLSLAPGIFTETIYLH